MGSRNSRCILYDFISSNEQSKLKIRMNSSRVRTGNFEGWLAREGGVPLVGKDPSHLPVTPRSKCKLVYTAPPPPLPVIHYWDTPSPEDRNIHLKTLPSFAGDKKALLIHAILWDFLYVDFWVRADDLTVELSINSKNVWQSRKTFCLNWVIYHLSEATLQL